MKERDKGREGSNKARWVGGASALPKSHPMEAGGGGVEMVSTVTAGSWWPGMWAINSAVGRFTPPSPLPLCLLLGWGEESPTPSPSHPAEMS